VGFEGRIDEEMLNGGWLIGKRPGMDHADGHERHEGGRRRPGYSQAWICVRSRSSPLVRVVLRA
jgi:hypothetical protein